MNTISLLMQTLSLFCLFLLVELGIAQPLAPADAPNIVFVIADDVNWNDLGCYGNPRIQTPNIDRLARQGIRFTNVFLTASSCSPSRTSILTGRYPHNTGSAELHTPLPAHLPLLRLDKTTGPPER